jgi:ribosomal protein L7/L12
MKLLFTVIAIVVGLWALNASRRWKSQHAELMRLPAPGEGTDEDVRRFVRVGRKMTAIKLYREIHDVGLKEAKEAVDAMVREINPRR